jgi:hypothetical protein
MKLPMPQPGSSVAHVVMWRPGVPLDGGWGMAALNAT